MNDSPAIPLASLIPEFFYDLIARVPAGAVFVLGVILLTTPETTWTELLGLAHEGKLEGVPFWLLFALLFMLSYAVGILLTLPGWLIRNTYLLWVWRRADRRHGQQIADLATSRGLLPTSTTQALATLGRSQRGTLYRLLEDELKASDEQARVLLPKMNGEASLCDNLTAAFLLLLLLGLLRYGCDIKVILIVIPVVWCYIAAPYRYGSLVDRLLSFAGDPKHRGAAGAHTA
jgi:hypothetical protein